MFCRECRRLSIRPCRSRPLRPSGTKGSRADPQRPAVGFCQNLFFVHGDGIIVWSQLYLKEERVEGTSFVFPGDRDADQGRQVGRDGGDGQDRQYGGFDQGSVCERRRLVQFIGCLRPVYNDNPIVLDEWN